MTQRIKIYATRETFIQEFEFQRTVWMVLANALFQNINNGGLVHLLSAQRLLRIEKNLK